MQKARGGEKENTNPIRRESGIIKSPSRWRNTGKGNKKMTPVVEVDKFYELYKEKCFSFFYTPDNKTAHAIKGGGKHIKKHPHDVAHRAAVSCAIKDRRSSRYSMGGQFPWETVIVDVYPIEVKGHRFVCETVVGEKKKTARDVASFLDRVLK